MYLLLWRIIKNIIYRSNLDSMLMIWGFLRCYGRCGNADVHNEKKYLSCYLVKIVLQSYWFWRYTVIWHMLECPIHWTSCVKSFGYQKGEQKLDVFCYNVFICKQYTGPSFCLPNMPSFKVRTIPVYRPWLPWTYPS